MITDKDNVEVVKAKFFSKQFRKTPVVILTLILAGFTVMGWFSAVEKLSQYNEANMQVINVTVVKK